MCSLKTFSLELSTLEYWIASGHSPLGPANRKSNLLERNRQFARDRDRLCEIERMSQEPALGANEGLAALVEASGNLTSAVTALLAAQSAASAREEKLS